MLDELGQLLLVAFEGTTATDNRPLDRLLCEVRVSGVVLLADSNIESPGQLRTLTADLQRRSRECTGRPLLIATDAEGGEVMRLSPRGGWEPTLSHAELGRTGDLALTELEARRIGFMLRDAGVNWNLAPVVDVGYNPANPVIVEHGRSFAAHPLRVAAQARAYLRGLRAAAILTTLKHFPGHGSSYADSHAGFADVTETADAEVELYPYRALLGEGLVDAVMTAHVFNRHLDPDFPATLSPATLTGLLRQEVQWAGVIVSDDLRMGAIGTDYGFAEAAVQAVRAGVDLLLIGDDRLDDGRSAAVTALAALRRAVEDGRLSDARIAASLERIRRLTAKL